MSIRSTIFTIVCLESVCVLMLLPGTFGDKDVQENDHKIIVQLQEEMATLKNRLHNYENYEKMLEEYERRFVVTDDKLEELEVAVNNVEASRSFSGGATFTWWGRSLCQQDRDSVYSGLTARGDEAHAGGGVDFQCLPLNPEYANYMDGDQYGTPGRGLIFSVEYQGNPDEIFDADNLVGTTFLDQEVPCTVCHFTDRTSVLMIPAQKTCPSGWTEEYWGYLVSSQYNVIGPSTHICVDHAPEVGNSSTPGDAHQNGVIFHVEVTCGPTYGLPCPSYKDGWELTCVVCSK